jgi:deoxyribonuclease V
MLACVDVDYRDNRAWAACLLFEAWTDSDARVTLVERIDSVQPYVPGEFFRRELPCLLAVLARAPALPVTIVVDGYVWLDAERRPGLGAHLYEALGGAAAVIGVAKSPFAGNVALPVRRGGGLKSLWVTAVGMDEERAVECIRQMDGPFRIPTLLKAVDRACRLAA